MFVMYEPFLNWNLWASLSSLMLAGFHIMTAFEFVS